MSLSLFRNAALVVFSLGLCGCAGLKTMVSDFDKRWEEPHAVLEGGQTAAKLSNEDKETLITTMEAASDAGDCESAIGSANQIVAVDEKNVSALLVLGECELNARDLASAEARFSTVNSFGKNERALRGLGAIAVLEERPEDARQFLYDAITLYSGDWKSWNSLGYAEDLLENWVETENAYRRSASLDSQTAAPLNNLGMSLVRQKKYDEAISTFQEALRRDPELETAHLNMRIAYALKGEYGQALAGASESQRAVVLNNVGVAAMARGELELAKRMFRDALDVNPTFYAVAFNNLERATLMSEE